MVGCSFLHDAERGVEFRERLADFDLVITLVHPSRDGFMGFIQLRLFFVRLGEQLFVDDLALKLDVSIGLLQPVFDLEMMHLLGKHFLDFQRIVAQEDFLLVRFQQLEYQADLG